VVRHKERLFAQLLLCADSLALLASWLAAVWMRAGPLSGPYGELGISSDYWWVGLAVVPIWSACQSFYGLYESAAYRSPKKVAKTLIRAHLLAALAVTSLVYLLPRPPVSRLVLEPFFLLGYAALLGEKVAVVRLLAWRARRNRERKAWQVLLIGDEAGRKQFVKLLNDHPYWAVEVAAQLPAVPYNGNGKGNPGHDWSKLFSRCVVDEVVVIPGEPGVNGTAELQAMCAERGIVCRTLVQLPAASAGKYFVDDLGEGLFLVSLESGVQAYLPMVIKRLIDIVGALAGLMVAAVIGAWYWLRLRKESPGPLLFKQKRVGRNGRLFTCYKFRTMCLDAEQRQQALLNMSKTGAAFLKVENDPRVLPSGTLLRRYYLDELPQFWNVLKGEMSLVGPRPSQPLEVQSYDWRHHRRLSTKPGLTGLFQINGHGAVSSFEDVVKLDCEYIDKWSLWLDCKIIGKTILKMVRGGGW
jgi:exopolysaccharide biosynthesis polyprenyl glycosylphosphotransferase